MDFSLFAILELTFQVLQTKISKLCSFSVFFFFFLLKVETQMLLNIYFSLMLLVIKMRNMSNGDEI